jgi:hypothetical protein
MIFVLRNLDTAMSFGEKFGDDVERENDKILLSVSWIMTFWNDKEWYATVGVT